MNQIIETIHRGLVTGLQWAVTRAVRIVMLGGIVRVGMWIYGTPKSEPALVRLADASLSQLSAAIILPIFTLILAWGVLFHEDRK